MADSWETVGIVKKASSGRSLKLELHLPNTVFTETVYISLKRLQEVLDGHRKHTEIYQLNKEPRNLSCEKPELKG